eukprot:30294-Pelagococcus_subviridis.AAC.7
MSVTANDTATTRTATRTIGCPTISAYRMMSVFSSSFSSSFSVVFFAVRSIGGSDLKRANDAIHEVSGEERVEQRGENSHRAFDIFQIRGRDPEPRRAVGVARVAELLFDVRRGFRRGRARGVRRVPRLVGDVPPRLVRVAPKLRAFVFHERRRRVRLVLEPFPSRLRFRALAFGVRDRARVRRRVRRRRIAPRRRVVIVEKRRHARGREAPDRGLGYPRDVADEIRARCVRGVRDRDRPRGDDVVHRVHARRDIRRQVWDVERVQDRHPRRRHVRGYPDVQRVRGGADFVERFEPTRRLPDKLNHRLRERLHGQDVRAHGRHRRAFHKLQRVRGLESGRA